MKPPRPPSGAAARRAVFFTRSRPLHDPAAEVQTAAGSFGAGPHPQHRPDIDGLRAIAVLSVIAYHAFPHRISGGFAGVDVFFVISGYLISGILFRGARAGGINFFDFYRRRINRIFPSLIAVLVFCLGFGWIALFPQEFHQLGADVASGASFSSNFSLLGEAGYFDRDAATKPLLHLWSLAVEEQFYILWPVLIWAIWRVKQKWTVFIAVFAALSFGYNVWASMHDPVADFYSPFCRFWEPALGALLAAMFFEKPQPAVSRGENWPAVAGFIALGCSICCYSSAQYPGAKALLPVLGAMLIIAAGPRAALNRVVLSHGVLRWIGLISYPLYLWHWPLLAFARILEGQSPSAIIRAGAVTAAVLLAALTHYFIENPMRFGRYPVSKMAAAVGCMILAGWAGQYVFLKHGLPARSVVAINPRLRSGDAGGAGPAVIDQCYENPARPPITDGCEMDSRETPVFALIGDSKAGALAPGVFRTSSAGGRWVYMGNNRAKGGYLSATLISQTEYPREYDLTRTMLDTLKAHPAIRAVVIANATRAIFHLKDDVTIDDLPGSPYGATALAAFDRAVSEITSQRKMVYLVVDNPTLGHPEDCIGRITSSAPVNHLLGLPAYPQDCAIAYTRFENLSRRYHLLLGQLVSRRPRNVKLIETSDIFCDRKANLCPMSRNGKLLYGYSDHPSDYASGIIGARVNALVRKDILATGGRHHRSHNGETRKK